MATSTSPTNGNPTAASSNMSLGNLPAPQFGTMPSGQRSVPAVEASNRLLSSSGLPFKAGPSSGISSGDGQRTPGGSLVIGAEVFGFGPSASKLKDTWTSPDVAGTGSSDNSSPWPTELTPSSLTSTHQNGERPGLKSFGSSIDLRPTGLTAPQELSNPQRPTANRSKTSMNLDSATLGDTSSVFASSSHTTLPSTIKQPVLNDLPSTSTPSFSQQAPRNPIDDITAGLRQTSMRDDNVQMGQRAAPQGMPRQTMPMTSPYQGYPVADHYAGYDPAYFAGPPVDAFGNRRDSGYASTPGLFGAVDNRAPAAVAQQVYRRTPPVGPAWGASPASGPYSGQAADYGQAASDAVSRQGSFSYSPSPAGYPQYGIAPSSLYGSPVDAGSPVFGSAALMAPRGMRPDYLPPGAGAPPMVGYGHWPMVADVARMMRSPLLEEFRTNRHRNWELTDILGHIVEFSGDQLGSRHIQQKLETASSEEKQLVFDEILPNILQLSTDVFANYVVQKFFEQGSQAQKAAMAKMLEGHVLQLSLQMYGCRVIQKAIEHVLVEQQVRIVKELDGHILRCSRDAQANHVVQRALERVPPEHLNFITDACLGQVHALATHPYGCRVLQRIFENCPSSQSRELLDELQRYSHNLIQDQYGNYVIQWVIEKGNPADRSLVIAKTYGQMLPLSQQKFSSNVMEKCIQYGTEDERHRLIEEIMQTLPDGSSVVKAMLTHPYANYVMQKILNYVQGDQRAALFQMTAVELGNLRKYSTTYSKHLLAIEKLLATERGGRPF